MSGNDHYPSTIVRLLTFNAKLARRCALSALCLRVFHCFSWPYVSSLALHRVENTFKRAFDSHTLPPFFNNLQTTKSLGNQFTGTSAMRTTFE